MALKALVLVLTFSSCVNCLAQKITLALYDFASGSGLSNRVLVDSAATIEGASFHPTEPLVYYARRSKSGWEIVSFNTDSKESNVLATSAERMAHPQITPDGKAISYLSGEGGKLMKMLTAGMKSSIIYDADLTNYLWVDENAILAVAKGDPNQLLLVTLRPKKVLPVAQHVGRDLRRSGQTIAFVHKLSVDSWSIKKINADGSIGIMAETVPDSDQFAILKDKVLMISEGVIQMQDRSSGWKPIELPENRNAEIKSIGANAAGDKLFILFATP